MKDELIKIDEKNLDTNGPNWSNIWKILDGDDERITIEIDKKFNQLELIARGTFLLKKKRRITYFLYRKN